MERRVGLLGGTFDPPHLGHLVVAECARVAIELDEVRFVVAGAPWMKAESATGPQRVAMTRLAADGHQRFRVDDREVRRDGPTYTVETLTELHSEEPGTAWWFLLGADAAANLDRWKRPEDCLELATFVAVTRPGHTLDLSGPLRGRLRLLEVPAIGISSTDLRWRFARGDAVRYQLPATVERYVREHRLYREARDG